MTWLYKHKNELHIWFAIAVAVLLIFLATAKHVIDQKELPHRRDSIEQVTKDIEIEIEKNRARYVEAIDNIDRLDDDSVCQLFWELLHEHSFYGEARQFDITDGRD